MKRCYRFYIIASFLVLFGMIGAEGFAQNTDSHVTLSLQELRELLKLDTDEIRLTWDEFQQLVQQSGEELKIPYTIENGKVILPREQFQRLLDRMKSPEAAILTAPADYIITKAEYSGKLDGKNAIFTAVFALQVFEQEDLGYRQIPFLPQSVALTEVLLDDNPALVVEENGWYAVTTAEPGQHLLKVAYFAPHNLDKGPQILALSVIKTAITLFTIELPLEDVDLDVPSAKEVTIAQEEGVLRVSAVLPATELITVNVHRKYPTAEEIAAPAEEIPAKIYAEAFHLLSIEEDALRVHSRIKLNVLQKPINFIEVTAPKGYSILYVRKEDGSELRDWQTRDTEIGVVVTIPFDTPLEGNTVLTILSERLFEGETADMTFHGFQVLGAIRETGFLGAEKKSTAEAIPTASDALDRIDIQDIPYDLIAMSERPLLFGFRYLRHPFNLDVTITRHEELPVISSVIDMASVITVVLEDGKMLTKVVYTMRNTWKQFLTLDLPPGSEVWTVYVAGKRENSSKNKEGQFLIPLTRSEMQGELLQSFTVDLMYYTKGDAFSALGSRAANFPTADVMISKMLWSVYLPQDFRYLHFSGNVEKEEIAETISLLTGKRRDYNLGFTDTYKKVAENIERDKKSWERMTDEEQSLSSNFRFNQAIRQEDIVNQMRIEADLDQMIQDEKQRGVGQPGSGGDIFRIELPTSGQIYRFNKTVIEGEPLNLSFYFVSRRAMTWIKVVFWLILVLLAIRFRKPIAKLLRWLYHLIADRAFLQTDAGLRMALLVSAVVFYFLSPVVFVVLTLLFWVSIFRPDWLLRKKDTTTN